MYVVVERADSVSRVRVYNIIGLQYRDWIGTQGLGLE